jgi:hypothetical protein
MGYFDNIPIKIEKVASHPSFLKTTDSQSSKTEQSDFKNELNKTTVYLLTTETAKKKQLLLIQSDSRLNSEKSIIEMRHQTFLKRIKSEKKNRSPRSRKEAHKNGLRFKLPKPKVSSNGIWLNNLSKTDKNLSWKSARSQDPRHQPLRMAELPNIIGKHRKDFFRDTQSYFLTEKKNAKAICPVFFDKISAEEFLLQTCESSAFEENTKAKKSIIESYLQLLKIQEIANLEFSESFTYFDEQLNLQTQKTKQTENKIAEEKRVAEETAVTEEQEILNTKQNPALNFFKKANVRTKLKAKKVTLEAKLKAKKVVLETRIKILQASQDKQLKTYLTVQKYFNDSFQNYEDMFESLKVFAKNIKPTSYSKRLTKTKVIAVGLGDLIHSYSSQPKANDLKYFQFLFFPEEPEEIGFKNEKSLVSEVEFGRNLGKGKKHFFERLSDSKLKSLTFRDYQQRYFGKL